MQVSQHMLERITKVSNSLRYNKPKPLSVSAVLNALKEPFDAVAVATKCNANPNSQYFGMGVDVIVAGWANKGSFAANRGMGLDEYVQASLNLDMCPISEGEQNEDESVTVRNSARKFMIVPSTLVKRATWFDIFKRDVLERAGYSLVGSELWLNSSAGVRGRSDAIFEREDALSVFDWKNSENIEYSNPWRKCLGPLAQYDDCDAVKFTTQVYLYKYLLELDYGVHVQATRVIQFNDTGYFIRKPAYLYDASLIRECIEWAKTINNAERNSQESHTA